MLKNISLLAVRCELCEKGKRQLYHTTDVYHGLGVIVSQMRNYHLFPPNID